MQILIDWGYLGLFVSAFLAATVLPLSSEAVLTGLLLSGMSPLLLVSVATAGNVLGSVVNYVLGYWANHQVMQRWLGVTSDKMRKAEQRFKRYGLWSLLFAWVPVIGDPITVVAGMLRVRFGLFLVLVSIGKFLRYFLLALIFFSA